MKKAHLEIDGVRLSHDVDRPVSKQFRDAWVLTGGIVTVDLAKAKEIHKARLRFERLERWHKAGGPFGPPITEKMKGVDSDPRIDAAKSVEELKALTLDVLLED